MHLRPCVAFFLKLRVRLEKRTIQILTVTKLALRKEMESTELENRRRTVIVRAYVASALQICDVRACDESA